MRAVVLAYNNIGCAGLAGLLRHGYEVAAVFTHADDPNENCWFDSVAELAAKHNIPVFAPEDINHPLWVKRIREMKPDVLFSFYYRKMVGAAILALPPAGGMNLHGSLLPRYRGKCPLNWVLVHGEKETGVTLHHMTAAPDAGDIVAQARVAIDGEDTAFTLSGKLTRAAVKLLDETLPKIKAGNAPRTPQDKAKASYFGGRRPADGEIQWGQTAEQVRNLVRAVTRPWPGAFTYLRTKKIFVWSTGARGKKGVRPQLPERPEGCCAQMGSDPFFAAPGTVVSVNPLVIACGEGGLEITSAQPEGGVAMSGAQLARELNLVEGMTLGPKATRRTAGRKQNVLILGANGFIGSALSERLLETGRHAVFGLDLWSNNLGQVLGRPGFEFREGDIAIHREWIEYHIRKCDVIVPLVAIATPIEYVRNPLRVFELDFEENLRIIRYCAKYKKRLIFPSTSEVYGMCNEEEFDEDRSKLILGPINKQRWIYSSCKQLLDRVIWAYGYQQGLKFTLFRPFNWIGPRLDSLDAARIGSSRVITQLILNLTEGSPILLIDGGEQKRCFTDVRDGIEGLYRIIENEGGLCDGRIINIGNPAGELSIRELAQMLVAKFDQHPLRGKFPPFAGYREVESESYYGGGGYEDVQHRRPSIRNARTLLKWEPTVGLEESIEKTLDFFLRDLMANSGSMTNDEAKMTNH